MTAPHTGPTGPTGPTGSDQLVRDVLGALADQVTVSPDAYHHVRTEFVRRQRQRKRLGVVVAIVLVVIADVIGLWALDRADQGDPVIFEQRPPAGPEQSPVPRLGQP